MKSKKLVLKLSVFAMVFCILNFTELTTASLAGAVDFSGKKITMIIPFKEGGGSSVHARFFVPLLEKALPGNPTILIRNIDGGGSVKGINYFADHAKPDGMMIAGTGSGTFFKYILGDKTVKYNLPEFIPFLSSPFGVIVYARSEIGVKGPGDIKKLQGMPLIFAGSGPTAGDLPALLSFDLLGIKLKTVFGLDNAESRQAFNRGESNINYDNMASWSSKVLPMVKDGSAVPLFTYGFRGKGGKIGRDPLLPDIPTFLEVYQSIHGKELSGTERKVWLTLFNIRVTGAKMYVLPAGTPKDIVDTYNTAMDKVVVSAEFNSKQGKKILGGYPQTTGTDAVETLTEAAVLNADESAWLKTWLKKTHGVQ